MKKPAPGATDQRLAMAALEKRRHGDKPTREEAAALRRYESQVEAQRREKYYREVPKKLWRDWSGRQHKVILEQSDRYNFPMLRGPTIDLPAFVARWYDWLAEIAPILSIAKRTGVTPENLESALERYRAARAKREEFGYQRDLGRWMPLDKVREGLGLFSSIMRNAGETLGRQFGEDARRILDDALNDSISVFRGHFGDERGNNDSTDGTPA